MLTQYRLTLTPAAPCRPRREWAYRLYAALLERAPARFGAGAHRDGVTPVSQFLVPGGDGLLWTVNLLGEESEAALVPVLASAEAFHLEKDRADLAVASRTAETVADVEDLLLRGAHHGELFRLGFRTAAAFKSRGQYLNLPTARLILQSLVKKWNGCFPDCPIEDEDGEGLEALAAGLRCREFRLQNRMYYLKGSSIPGFVGDLTLENRLDGFQRDLTGALLLFAGYAGVGIKTALGMGGVDVE